MRRTVARKQWEDSGLNYRVPPRICGDLPLTFGATVHLSQDRKERRGGVGWWDREEERKKKYGQMRREET